MRLFGTRRPPVIDVKSMGEIRSLFLNQNSFIAAQFMDIRKELKQVADQVVELNTLLDGIATQVGQMATETERIATEQAQLVADLTTAHQAPTPPDLTATLAKAQAINDAMNTQTINLRNAADAMQAAVAANTPPPPAAAPAG